jgi:hypothetical protein
MRARSIAALFCLAAGCGSSAAPAVTLSDGQRTRPLAAYYSIFVEPLDMGTTEIELVVTLIDPAFTCGGAPAPGLDALSFGFDARVPGATDVGVFARSGPLLGATTGGAGQARLTAVDDRYQGFDGGAVDVAPGGAISGRVSYRIGELDFEGVFTARHCAALDFVATT